MKQYWGIGLRGFLAALFLIIAAGTACDRQSPQTVSLEKRQELPASKVLAHEKPLTLCVGSMITPQDGYGYYRQLINYLAEKLDLHITALDPGSYEEVNRLLETGRVDVAFICSGPYVEGHARFGLNLLAAPVVNDEPLYYSNLIVPSGSSARRLADLRGKTFAFADPHSNSGAMVPMSKLAEMGETPESFFDSFLFTYGHDRSIRAVADGLVDGAAVDSLIWDFLVANTPGLHDKVRVIERFGPFGIPPVVTGKHVDPVMRAALQKILLAMHDDPRGRDILKGMHIERFTQIDDSAYDSVRELQRFIENQRQQP
jgi:phosphonate transport system substrate-binding protein